MTPQRPTFSWLAMRPILAATAVFALNGVLAYAGTIHSDNATVTALLALGVAGVSDLTGWLTAQRTPAADAEINPLEGVIEEYAQSATRAATAAALKAVQDLHLPAQPPTVQTGLTGLGQHLSVTAASATVTHPA